MERSCLFPVPASQLVCCDSLSVLQLPASCQQCPLCSVPSMNGHSVVPQSVVHFYSATKYAVTALTEGLRQELREARTHIRATVSAQGSLCPGRATAMGHSLGSSQGSAGTVLSTPGMGRRCCGKRGAPCQGRDFLGGQLFVGGHSAGLLVLTQSFSMFFLASLPPGKYHSAHSAKKWVGKENNRKTI